MTKEEREEAITYGKEQLEIFGGKHAEFIKLAIKSLEQEPKTGHWIRVDKTKVKCSNCEITHLIAQYPHGRIDYCPNCGAKMGGEK